MELDAANDEVRAQTLNDGKYSLADQAERLSEQFWCNKFLWTACGVGLTLFFVCVDSKMPNTKNWEFYALNMFRIPEGSTRSHMILPVASIAIRETFIGFSEFFPTCATVEVARFQRAKDEKNEWPACNFWRDTRCTSQRCGIQNQPFPNWYTIRCTKTYDISARLDFKKTDNIKI